MPQDQPATEQADRQVDQKDPVPGQHRHQQTTEQRPDQRPHQRRQGQPRHGLQQLLAARPTQDDHLPHRCHQCPGSPLQHAPQAQLPERIGQGAGQRGAGEQAHRRQHDLARAKALGSPATDRHAQGQGKHVQRHHQIHAQPRLAEIGGHLRQGGHYRSAVEQFHEQGGTDDHRYLGALHMAGQQGRLGGQNSPETGGRVPLSCQAPTTAAFH